MYYEIYADSIFLLQFFMNLYLLEIVNHMIYRAASRRRIVIGAGIGAGVSLLPFFLPIRFGYSTLLSFFLSTLVMSVYTFRACKGGQIYRVVEKMLIGTLLLGGILLFLLRLLPSGESGALGVTGVLAIGAVCYWVVQHWIYGKSQELNLCKVIFPQEMHAVEVDALVDTGNSLVEPVSRRPVVVVEEEVFHKLFSDKIPEYYRVIPYQSVGKRHGLLKGYHIDTVQVEIQGIRKECRNIYIAVSEEILSRRDEYKLILNPQMLEE